MAPLLLDLKSPTVDVVLKWMKDGKLPGFDLLGRVDEGVANWSQDLLKKQLLTRFDFGNYGMDLDLSDQELSRERVAELAQALSGDESLTGLHLSRTHLGDEGVELLSKAMSKASALQVLSLSRNGLSEKACAGLANVLKKSTTLKTLDLGGNAIGSAGVAAISGGLMENDFLTDLDLSANGIADEGAECLAAAVEANPHTLALLDLSGNKLSEGGAEMLTAAFVASSAPGRLHLGGGPARPYWSIEGDKSQQFTVRCTPGDVRITPGRRNPWEPPAGRPEPKPVVPQEGPAPAPGAGESDSPIEAEMSFEQEEDELDVCFRSDAILERDRELMSVEITARRLVVRVKEQVLLDAELYSLAEPAESSWTVRDGVLEIYLVKAQEGEEWPRLTCE